MKAIKYILPLLLALLLFSTCKKDYPKDIPDWLEDKIKEFKKGTRGYVDCLYECRYIHEYSDGTKTTFWIMPGFTPIDHQVWDYEGNYLCNGDPQGSPSVKCDSTHIYGQVFVRKIWEEKY